MSRTHTRKNEETGTLRNKINCGGIGTIQNEYRPSPNFFSDHPFHINLSPQEYMTLSDKTNLSILQYFH